MQFGHIGIKVRDLEKSLDFYQQVLSCKVIKEYLYPDMQLVFLDAHGTIIELIHKKERPAPQSGSIEHIAFKVESLDEKIALLNERGITYSPPKTVGKARIIYIEGPDQEKFEFVEMIS